MDLELKKNRFEYYRKQALAPMNCETMREHIVPDSCADIARIVDTSGQVRVTGRELGSDGRICASGHVDVSVLYIPEKGRGPCVLRFQLPFQCSSDEQIDVDAEYPDISGELQNLDTRLLNPRKVLTRINLVLHPSICCRKSDYICVDVCQREDLELLHCRRQTRVIAAVREKEFTFVEELPVPPVRGGVEEIISCHTELTGTDCKLIGTKLVLKGVVAVSVLYRDSEGDLQTTRGEFPFSQILDGSGLQEDWEYDTAYHTLSFDCRIGSESGLDDRHVLTLTMLLRARVTASRRDEIDFISDLYSTQHHMTCSTRELALQEDHFRHSKRISVRETLETGTPIKTIIETECGCSTVKIDVSLRMLEIPMWARCLYLDEGDALHSVRREFSVKCPLEHDTDLQTECVAHCGSEITVGILPDGIELRFPVECSVEVVRPTVYLSIDSVEIEENQQETPTPSLVLRKISEEETLWSVAKAHRTTCRAILDINELTDEQHIPREKLLLIPRCR